MAILQLPKWVLSRQQAAMEGKEVRFGAAASAYWSIVTTSTSNGSVNAMHDSSMPLSGMMAMLGYDDQCILWRCRCRYSELLYLHHHRCIYFRLMVGRTPEFMGHKVEAREVKIAALVTLYCRIPNKRWNCIGMPIFSYIMAMQTGR